MRKTIIIRCIWAAAALLSPACLFAQPASWSGHLYAVNPQEGNVIVRKWTDEYVVSAYQESGTQYFAINRILDFLSNSSGSVVYPSAHTTSMPAGLDVSDFCIVGDTLFFCGIWNSEAAFGWMRLSLSLSPPTFPNHVYTINTTPIAKLDKILVYKENGYHHMVALGSNATSSFIVEVPHMFIDTTMVLTACMNHTSPVLKDRLDDLEELDNMLVFTGQDTRAGNNIATVRLVGKTNELVNSYDLNTQYRISQGAYSVTGPVLTSRTADFSNFAMACKLEGPGYTYLMRLHNLLAPSVGGLQLLSTQDVPALNMDLLREMTYLNADIVLLLFHRHTYDSYILPAPLLATSSYTTNAFRQLGKLFMTVDRLGGNAFVSWGDSHDLLLQKNGGPACIGTETFLVSPGPDNTVNPIVDSPVRKIYTVTAHHDTNTWMSCTTFTDCDISY